MNAFTRLLAVAFAVRQGAAGQACLGRVCLIPPSHQPAKLILNGGIGWLRLAFFHPMVLPMVSAATIWLKIGSSSANLTEISLPASRTRISPGLT